MPKFNAHKASVQLMLSDDLLARFHGGGCGVPRVSLIHGKERICSQTRGYHTCWVSSDVCAHCEGPIVAINAGSSGSLSLGNTFIMMCYHCSVESSISSPAALVTFTRPQLMELNRLRLYRAVFESLFRPGFNPTSYKIQNALSDERAYNYVISRINSDGEIVLDSGEPVTTLHCVSRKAEDHKNLAQFIRYAILTTNNLTLPASAPASAPAPAPNKTTHSVTRKIAGVSIQIGPVSMSISGNAGDRIPASGGRP